MMIAPNPDKSSADQREFEDAARALNMDPQNQWVGEYANYEWHHLRPLLNIYRMNVAGKDVLELGCNVGASSVVLSAVGANVHAVDIDPGMIRIAAANIARHGLKNKAKAQLVKDTRKLPFTDEQFDHIIANSVLEYVSSDHLTALIAELQRVLKPGGSLFICGTASRLAPREIHSGRWLINYVPRIFDRFWGHNFQRGLSPILLRRSLEGRFENQSASSWIQARAAIHGKLSLPIKAMNILANFLCVSPGWLSPHLEMRLEKKIN
ncbi:MAG: hypothetical protein Pars2KO_12690 [Parasphingorhabdus sp.]